MKMLLSLLVALMLLVASTAFVQAKPISKSYKCKHVGIPKVHNKKFKVMPRITLPPMARAARYQSHGI